ISVSLSRGSFDDSGSLTPSARPLSTAYACECPARINRSHEGADDQPAPVSPVRTSSRNAFTFFGDPSVFESFPFTQFIEGTTSTNGRLLSASCLASGNVSLFT